ncbi:Mis12 protein-domain-containing protein [Xylaria sp. CBS 124048]|nr:Mis12 protein-domain-containing protein [Xylaria sp. CBS 124048]
MTTSLNSETELLTEHFGYPPVSLIDDIINSINILAERALNSIEQGLVNAPPAALGFKAPKASKSQSAQSQQDADIPSPAERAKEEIESGTHQLETLLCASIDRNFDKFELYVLRNILTVNPPELCNWIRLSHYDGLDFSYSPSVVRHNHGSQNIQKDAPTIESITILRRRLRESMRLNALLTAERARNDALLQDLRRLIGPPGGPQVKAESASPEQRGSAEVNANTNTANNQGIANDASKRNEVKSPFAFLHQKGDLASSGGGAAPLSTTAAFTLSQMQALRALSTALRNLTPDLKGLSVAQTLDGESSDGPRGAPSWRRERVEYVEAATRRHLEIMHGLELGKNGEVRDGEWQGPGQNLPRGEVEGLERVVSLVQDDNGNGDRPTAVGGPVSEVIVAEGEHSDRMDES